MINDEVNTSRRRFLVASTAAVGAAGAVGIAVPFLGSWQPSAKAKAAGAPVTIDISKLRPGEMVTEEWRGKPVFVLRRTPEQLANIEKLNAAVADPDSKNSAQPAYISGIARAVKEEYLIVLGLCTHLGCSPKHRPEIAPADLGGDWLGGFFCPCHGSKFDLSGRVYKAVPAPTNLEVPPHRYQSDFVVVIGEDGGAA